MMFFNILSIATVTNKHTVLPKVESKNHKYHFKVKLGNLIEIESRKSTIENGKVLSEVKKRHKINTWKLCIFHSHYINSCESQVKI